MTALVSVLAEVGERHKAGMRVANSISSSWISSSWISFRFDLYSSSSSDSSFFGFGPADLAERVVVDVDEHRRQSASSLGRQNDEKARRKRDGLGS